MTRRRVTRVDSINRAKFYFDYLINYGVEPNLARLLVVQSAHETGGWSSRIYRELNNAFGMELPRRRKTLAMPSGERKARFESTEDSFLDMLLWLNSRQSFLPLNVAGMNIADYVAWLKARAFYEDSVANYTNAMLRWDKIFRANDVYNLERSGK